MSFAQAYYENIRHDFAYGQTERRSNPTRWYNQPQYDAPTIQRSRYGYDSDERQYNYELSATSGNPHERQYGHDLSATGGNSNKRQNAYVSAFQSSNTDSASSNVLGSGTGHQEDTYEFLLPNEQLDEKSNHDLSAKSVRRENNYRITQQLILLRFYQQLDIDWLAIVICKLRVQRSKIGY